MRPIFPIGKKAIILFAALSMPAAAIDVHGPESWAQHGLIAGAIAGVAHDTPYRWIVSGAVCAGFLVREMTQRGGAFNDLDSNMDWAVPCAVSAGIAAIPIALPDGLGLGVVTDF